MLALVAMVLVLQIDSGDTAKSVRSVPPGERAVPFARSTEPPGIFRGAKNGIGSSGFPDNSDIDSFLIAHPAMKDFAIRAMLARAVAADGYRLGAAHAAFGTEIQRLAYLSPTERMILHDRLLASYLYRPSTIAHIPMVSITDILDYLIGQIFR
jgi:hypothetical protein